MSKLPESMVCLNVSPIDPEVRAALKARAALQREPLYIYINRILTAHLAELPPEPATPPVHASA